MLKKQRAIVSNVSGTTRDSIDEEIIFEGSFILKGKKNIKENFKQIALTIFAIMLIGVGYINFSMQTENQRNPRVQDRICQ